MLLLVANIMLSNSHLACGLDASNGFGKEDTGDVRIWAETCAHPLVPAFTMSEPRLIMALHTFPIPTTLRCASKRTRYRTQKRIHTLVTELLTHCDTSGVRKATRPCGSDIDTSWKDGGEVGVANGSGRILQA
jgi:hypothetical protein